MAKGSDRRVLASCPGCGGLVGSVLESVEGSADMAAQWARDGFDVIRRVVADDESCPPYCYGKCGRGGSGE
ncbi:hypothetical protein ABMA58_00085 [Oceanospirillum sp. HFRX-1_2]